MEINLSRLRKIFRGKIREKLRAKHGASHKTLYPILAQSNASPDVIDALVKNSLILKITILNTNKKKKSIYVAFVIFIKNIKADT